MSNLWILTGRGAAWSRSRCGRCRGGEVLGVLAKGGLERASCSFPDWQTLEHLVQLVQLPDASAAHTQFLRTRAGDYSPQVRARVEIGHFIGAVDHLTAIRAR